MRSPLAAWLAVSLALSAASSAAAFECYKNDGVTLNYRSQYCNPVTQPFCLKANVYDGRVIRDCASAQQCPMGNGCAPITYDADGTTDYVCCCSNSLCNASPAHWPSHFSLIAPSLIAIAPLLNAACGHLFAAARDASR